jgi:hypothetical protein
MAEALRYVGGGISLYLIIAACSTPAGNGGDDDSAGSSGVGTGGVSGSNSTGGLAGGGSSTGGVAGQSGAGGGLAGASGSGSGGSAPGFQSGTRLRARFVAGETSGKQFLGWYDTERGENCTFALASDGKQHCMPNGIGISNYYSDSDCTQPVVASSSADCVTGKLYGSTSENCGTQRVYELTEIAAPAALYIGSQCLSATPVGPRTYYTAVELPPSSFVGATEALD